MKAAYSYTRFSSAGQIGNSSLDRQIEEGREWYHREIAHLGIPLDETFTDSARSAYKGEHVGKKGDLGRFLAAIQSGTVSRGSILIAENLDRVSRQGNKIGRKLLEAIVDNGVDVHVVNIEKKLTYGWENRQNDYTIVDGELNRAFKESERKSKIIKAGLAKVKHTDDWCGILPFWLQKIYEKGAVEAPGNKAKPKYKIVEVPEKVAIIKEIFRLAATGLGAKRIMEALQAQGIKCPVSLGHLGELLRSRAVLGEHQPFRYLDTGAVEDGDPVLKFPQVVEQSQFDTVAARLDSKLKVCADGELRPGGKRCSHECENLLDGLLHDITDQPERSLHFQKKSEGANPYLISKWEPRRPSNRVRYDLFETSCLRFLTDADWKAIAGEKETDTLKLARIERDVVDSEIDRAKRLIAKRTEQMADPDLLDAVAKEFASQIVETRSKLATLEERRNRLESLIGLESAKSEALHNPELLKALIQGGDPAMRLNLRGEIRRLVLRVDLDFKAKPNKLRTVVTFINGATREGEFREPFTFYKPIPSPRRRRTRAMALQSR